MWPADLAMDRTPEPDQAHPPTPPELEGARELAPTGQVVGQVLRDTEQLGGLGDRHDMRIATASSVRLLLMCHSRTSVPPVRPLVGPSIRRDRGGDISVVPAQAGLASARALGYKLKPTTPRSETPTSAPKFIGEAGHDGNPQVDIQEAAGHAYALLAASLTRRPASVTRQQLSPLRTRTIQPGPAAKALGLVRAKATQSGVSGVHAGPVEDRLRPSRARTRLNSCDWHRHSGPNRAAPCHSAPDTSSFRLAGQACSSSW